jgi:hypothetical protein
MDRLGGLVASDSLDANENAGISNLLHKKQTKSHQSKFKEEYKMKIQTRQPVRARATTLVTVQSTQTRWTRRT